MVDFENEVLQRLTAIETKLENGISQRLKVVEDFIRQHPVVCPWINRRREMAYLAIVVGGAVGVIELIKWVAQLI